jgi:hypothetical protein
MKICLNAFSPENEILDDMLTLEACGCIGKITKTSDKNNDTINLELPIFQIYYDMKPVDLLDPLLLF